MAVASAGPYANNLRLVPHQHLKLNFYSPGALPDAHQHCQSTEGKTLINRKCHSHLRVPHVGELFSLRRSLPRLAVVLDVRDGARSSSDLEIQTLYASSPGDV